MGLKGFEKYFAKQVPLSLPKISASCVPGTPTTQQIILSQLILISHKSHLLLFWSLIDLLVGNCKNSFSSPIFVWKNLRWLMMEKDWQCLPSWKAIFKEYFLWFYLYNVKREFWLNSKIPKMPLLLYIFFFLAEWGPKGPAKGTNR